MAADLVPIRLSLTAGDRYTLWAPRWRDAGDEWEAFLGKGDDVYVFDTVADLVAFVRSDSDHDLIDHPAWTKFSGAHAHRFDPAEDRWFDLVGVEEVVAAKPSAKSVAALADTMAIVSSIGSVCELAAVTKFFNGNPSLGALSGGVGEFRGKAGLKRWDGIGQIVGRNWDDVLAAIDEVVATPDVDASVSARVAEELAEPLPEVDETADEAAEGASEEAGDAVVSAVGDDDASGRDEAAGETGAAGVGDVVLGGDEDFWLKVGIDPIRIMTGAGTVYTLRCYLDERPIFLGRNGRISVFSSERALARYLADEHDHDLSNLSTYDDIRTAATDGSLQVEVIDDNVYVLTGLVDDFADGPDAVDRDQLDLAVELLRDVGDYAEDNTVDKALSADRALGKLVAYVLEPDSVSRPAAPYAEAVQQWEELERFVESRLRRE